VFGYFLVDERRFNEFLLGIFSPLALYYGTTIRNGSRNSPLIYPEGTFGDIRRSLAGVSKVKNFGYNSRYSFGGKSKREHASVGTQNQG
ncbi:MAG: hypothetical protein JW732_05785, partial [Dehalococcoidia bacterium]|nr:hypothetical protein [Dehalococcoidia bacterium]